MTEFNWDLMPVELKDKLLELAGMDKALASVRWSGLDPDEQKQLNEALWNKTGGSATIGER